jgi:hypothetical protein
VRSLHEPTRRGRSIHLRVLSKPLLDRQLQTRLDGAIEEKKDRLRAHRSEPRSNPFVRAAQFRGNVSSGRRQNSEVAPRLFRWGNASGKDRGNERPVLHNHRAGFFPAAHHRSPDRFPTTKCILQAIGGLDGLDIRDSMSHPWRCRSYRFRTFGLKESRKSAAAA